MSEISEILEQYAPKYGIALTGDMLGQLELYAATLLEWSERMNLTAITQPNEIAIKHFLDSLFPLAAATIPYGASLIDIGSGAGFPGVVMKIARPDIRLTLLDSMKKRTEFLAELSGRLLQDNAIIRARAEAAGRDEAHREQYDFAAARAVATLPELCEYCLPFVKPGGAFIALKGPGAKLEAQNSKNALSLLSGDKPIIKEYSLPFDGTRNIIIIKKISQIPAKYPRPSAKITKTPL